jgi:hypothetical protein
MTFVFKHPNYYKELKKIRDSLGPEAEDQASSVKPQASSCEASSEGSVKPQAALNCRSDKVKHKHQASSSKAQASSAKRT